MTTELAIEILKTLKNTSTMPKNEDEIKLSLALDIALDMAIKSLEKIRHLKDRPCSACEFHSDNGCSKWNCVFDK